jgi:excisionase family DNA binding protein
MDTASGSDQGPRSLCDREFKIIVVSRQFEKLLVGQRMSYTSCGGDCESPLFPDDSDVARPSRDRFRSSEHCQRSTTEASILRVGGGVLIMSERTDLADVPALLYRVEEAAAALRLSRSVLYELIRSGQLRTVKQGRRRLVPVAALAEYVASLESGVA